MNLYALNDQFNLRQALPNDVPRIADIWLEGAGSAFGDLASGLPDRDGIERQLLKLVEQQTANFKFWLCIDKSGSVVGWSTVQPLHTSPLEQMRNAYGLISTYMSSNVQGRGIGGQLLQFVIDYCKHFTSVALVFGFQDRSNLSSVTIGDRVGFRDFGKLPLIEGLPPVSLIVCVTHDEGYHNASIQGSDDSDALGAC